MSDSRLLRLRNYVRSRALFPFVVNAAQIAAGVIPGQLNPTLDEINRFESAIEATFALAGHSVSAQSLPLAHHVS